MGNFSSLLDGGGTVAGRFVHGPHGEVEQRDASWGTTGPTVAFDYLRGTQRYDRRTQLHLGGGGGIAYDPVSERLLQPDMVKLAAERNAYPHRGPGRSGGACSASWRPYVTSI